MCLLTVLYFFGIRFSSLRTVLLWCEKNGTNTVLVRNLALPLPRSTVADVRSVDCTTPARSQHGVALSLSLSLSGIFPSRLVEELLFEMILK